MAIYLVQDIITCLNILPPHISILSDLNPAAIIIGSPNLDYIKLKITFGAYEQVYIGTTSNKKHRTVGEITLIPAIKWGGYYFMSLSTVKQLHAFICKERPINDQVIYRANDLATK